LTTRGYLTNGFYLADYGTISPSSSKGIIILEPHKIIISSNCIPFQGKSTEQLYKEINLLLLSFGM
jgi:hypothetical protein